MFLFPPEQYIKWLGYPSKGEFYNEAFTSTIALKYKLHSPCGKTLEHYFTPGHPTANTPQFLSFIKRLKDASISKGMDPVFFDSHDNDQLVRRGQFPILIQWPACFEGLKLSGFYPATCAEAGRILAQLHVLIENINSVEGDLKNQVVTSSHWVISSLEALGMGQILSNSSPRENTDSHSPSVVEVLHYLNIYCFIRVISVLDAEINKDVEFDKKHSLFSDLMPEYPLSKWNPFRVGIFNRLLAVFPSKEAGYRAFSTNSACEPASIKKSIHRFYASKMDATLKLKTVRPWVESALDVLSKDHEIDRQEVLDLFELKWKMSQILYGWLKTSSAESGPCNEQEVVTCFSHYQRLYDEAIINGC